MPTNVYNRCPKCDRLLPDTLICRVCSSELVQQRTEQALKLLVACVNEIRDYWTESVDNAMMHAQLVLRPTTSPPSHIKIEPKARQCPFCKLLHDPTKTNCNDPKTGALIRRAGPCDPIYLGIAQGYYAALDMAAKATSLTCVDFLEHAKDSMDAALSELQEANKTCSGMASLLLLDMIRETGVMAARIRRILHEARNEEQKQSLTKASNEADYYSRGLNPQSLPTNRVRTNEPGGKGEKRNLTQLHPATEGRGRIVRDEATGEKLQCCYLCGRPQDEHIDGHCPNP